MDIMKSSMGYPFKHIVDAVWLTTVIVVAFKKVRVLASVSCPIAAPFRITCTMGSPFKGSIAYATD
jgi:uncharacterized membrane protein YdfJ with MMPL/SSD domain